MATGLFTNNVCYENLLDAQNAYFASVPVASFPDLNPAFHQLVKFELSNGVWMRSVYQSSVTGDVLQSSTVAVAPSFPPCVAPSEMYVYGLEFGAAICMLMVLPFGFRAIHKVLR